MWPANDHGKFAPFDGTCFPSVVFPNGVKALVDHTSLCFLLGFLFGYSSPTFGFPGRMDAADCLCLVLPRCCRMIEDHRTAWNLLCHGFVKNTCRVDQDLPLKNTAFQLFG